MISTNDLKTGFTVEIDKELFTVVDFQHVKPGKGSAFVRTRLKNIKTGAVFEKTFRAGEKLIRAILDYREMQYLYRSGEDYVFMDMETYDQLNIPASQIGEGVVYLKDGMHINVNFYENKIVGVDMPNFVELKITHTEPGFRGDTATGATKSATLETGATVAVPLFVEIGDVIQIDTRTNTYLKRVSS